MRTNTDTELATLWRNFERFFELSLATTESERQAVYRFRYRIFCEKLGFVDSRALADRSEMDDFDGHSIHCYVTHRASGRIAGYVRLVTVDTSTDMPLERRCRGALYPATLRHAQNRRSSVAEISRLAVGYPFSGAGRAENRENVAKDLGRVSRDEQRTFPLIAVALMSGAGACAHILRRNECFALMERSLIARLQRVGIATTRVGEDIEYTGTVAPHLLEVDEAVRSLPQDLRIIYDDVHTLMAASIRAAGMQATLDGVQAAHGFAIASGLELSRP